MEKLINVLSDANVGQKVWDGPIGMAVGWTRKIEPVAEAGKPPKVTWLWPNGDVGPVPPFTTSLDAAELLVKTVAPNETWGVSMADGRAIAVVGDGPYCEAATTPLALCIAALRFKELSGK